jgi:oligopeptidase A
MNNPLLNFTGLPPFSTLHPEHVEPAIDALLQQNRQRLQQLLDATRAYTWDNLIQPIEDMDDRLSRTWSPISHMNSVVNNELLRAAYNACLPKLSDYATEIGQNERLYQAYQSIADSPAYANFSIAQRKVIQNALRDFRLSGVALPVAQKARYKDIMQALSSLTAKYEENLLDCSNAWKHHITDAQQLAGVPESALNLFAQTATQEGKTGWLITLDFPFYHPIMAYADNRELRRLLYTAYCTRASDQGPHDAKWDNSAIMEQILALRHEAAQLLGFSNYAERSLATKMAKSPQQVITFLHTLVARGKPAAERDMAELHQYAKTVHNLDTLETWDITYYAEKLRQEKYAISQEQLRPYFPLPKVLTGMFSVVERLYGITIQPATNIDTWHPDVQFYCIYDTDQNLRGQFYLDLYARPHKRGGAWMDECQGRRQLSDQRTQTPVAYLTCNFTPPVGQDPALLTHDEVETLFHEFGHGLHHMLTRIDCAPVAGISGVAWDAVELPSQFMENWCWEHEALALIAGHYQTGEALPADMLQKLKASKNFQSGMQLVRQLEFSLFDFRIHSEYEPTRGGRIYDILNDVRSQVAVLKPPAFNRFAHGFSHIFAGGYAAGYYSYKWAEVLSADAFSKFEETGIFNRNTGLAFLHSVLEQGGSRDAMELFVEFRGREPTIDALLRHQGLEA